MLRIPLSLLYLCQCTLLLGIGARAQQCRLVHHGTGSRSASGDGTTNPAAAPPVASGQADASATASGAAPTPTAFNYGSSTVRGVNLGGWFVLEPWITPSIFENTNNPAIIDEYTFGQMQDPKVALGILQNHWETWITEADFAAISAASLNHVRIPIGYWSVPMTSADTNYSTAVAPFIPGAWPYLLKALNWAKTYNLHVIIDLHGAPGSQNGYDNSGQRLAMPMWEQNPANVSRTLDTIKYIVENVGGMIDVIELLNEPAGFWGESYLQVISQFWQNGYNVVRATVGGGLKIMIGDAFQGVQAWQNFLSYPGAQGVIMDTHQYQVFNLSTLPLSNQGHISSACSLIPGLVSYASSNIWTVMGEWSTATTDCAMWLNGRGVGARWDGSIGPGSPVYGSCNGLSGNYSTFAPSFISFLRQYWEAQIQIGESIQGWIFWTWKTESADEWSYSKGLQGGWIPQNPTDRQYPNICS